MYLLYNNWHLIFNDYALLIVQYSKDLEICSTSKTCEIDSIVGKEAGHDSIFNSL